MLTSASTSSDAAHPVPPARYPNPYTAPPPGRLQSDTGELRWLNADRKRGVIAVATPRSQSLIGFVKGSGESVSHLAADVANEFCVLTLAALDDRPIARSGRLLLVATTGAAVNAGQLFAQDGQTLAAWGQGPVLIEPVAGSVTLRGLNCAKGVKATPLTAEGRIRAEAVHAMRDRDGWRVDLGASATTWWLLDVER
jgi:hypothetical protein